MANYATDFLYPTSCTRHEARPNYFIIGLKPYKSINKHNIYVTVYRNGSKYSNTTAHSKVGGGNYKIPLSSGAYSTNAYAVVQIDTYENGTTFVSGSFAHSVIIEGGTNNLYNCTVPTRTYPGEVCTINITKPKTKVSGYYCNIDILYNSAIGRQVIATNRQEGPFSFVVPAGATNSSMTARICTYNSAGRLIAELPQSIKIEKPNTSYNTTYQYVQKPQLILPSNHVLTLSEGVPFSVKGNSQNINDYKIIFTKQHCDVANAVSPYTSTNGYFDASKNDLKNRLLNSVTGSAEYFVLKDFDQSSTFITQDSSDKTKFNIRTPDTNEYKNINDFYALQWFKNVEPGDLIRLYAIQRGLKYTTLATTYNIAGENSQLNWPPVIAWRNLYGNGGTIYNNGYTKFDLSYPGSFFHQYNDNESSVEALVGISRATSYIPEVVLSTSYGIRNVNEKSALQNRITLTPMSGANASSFRYKIPNSYLKDLINRGYKDVYFYCFNNGDTSYYLVNAGIELRGMRQAKNYTEYNTTSSVDYSDGNWNSIWNIPLNNTTPYIVLPPAVKPVELALKERSANQITITYSNPLYNVKTDALASYNKLGQVSFDVSKGIDINDLSELNSIKSEDNEDMQIDKTLNLNIGEKRLLTYEKQIKIPDTLLKTIKNLPTKDIYADLKITSVDNKNINFKSITSTGIKLQIMLSNGDTKIRTLDFDNNVIDYKKNTYDIFKSVIDKNIFINNNIDTIHLLYNIDRYDNGKKFNVKNISMQAQGDKVLNKIGWRKINPSSNEFGTCSFISDTFEIAKYALNYDSYVLRLCLENMEADQNLFKAPVITVFHRKLNEKEDSQITILEPETTTSIEPGSDIYYEIPRELFNVNIDDVLRFEIKPASPYPINMPEITFSDAYIEVIGMENLEEAVDDYASGFNADVIFFEEKSTVANTSATPYDPVECIDVLMCCFNKNKQLINTTPNKYRDIYNGKDYIWYTDRKWHNFFNDKYSNHIKFKSHYDMTFPIPNETEYINFIAFTYSNWRDNPSIYSMSNILSIGSVQQDFKIEFINPEPIVDQIDSKVYAHSDTSNPEVTLKVSANTNSNMMSDSNMWTSGRNLAYGTWFDKAHWLERPILYSTTKKYGYELPIFKPTDAYTINNIVSSIEPLYNNIEYYYQWRNIYGKDLVKSPMQNITQNMVSINSKYTIFEDEADKFISNGAIPYIEIPAELANFDRSQITIFLDADFDNRD